jgi:hypothetical protein
MIEGRSTKVLLYIEKHCNLYSKIPSCKKATCIEANKKLSVQACKH